MKHVSGLPIALAAALTLLALAGCKKDAAPAAGDTGGDPALLEKGKTVYAANTCANCHTLEGVGGRGGPELSHVGGGGKNADALAAYVKQPRPGSRMPAFAGKISDDDLKALGAYLASLK